MDPTAQQDMAFLADHDFRAIVREYNQGLAEQMQQKQDHIQRAKQRLQALPDGSDRDQLSAALGIDLEREEQAIEMFNKSQEGLWEKFLDLRARIFFSGLRDEREELYEDVKKGLRLVKAKLQWGQEMEQELGELRGMVAEVSGHAPAASEAEENDV